MRQLGVQEVDIVSIVKPITKYAVTVLDPTTFAITWKRRSILRFTAGRDRFGSIFPWMSKPRQLMPDTLRGFDPAELHAPPIRI